MSRILRHVGANDFKRTRQRLVDEQRILSEKRRREEIREQNEKEEIAKLSAPFKSSWKADLFPEEVEVKETIEVVKEKKVKISEKWKYDWRKSFDEKPEKQLVEKELVEKVFEPITFIKNIKISDSIFDNFSNISNWRDELIEGMSSKDFPDLYGYGISIFDMPITSTIQNPVQSTKAQDIVNASADATDHKFGPQFPGSYRNVVGGVQSLSKVDVQAHITTDHEVTPNQGEMAHPEKHVFTYQSEGNSIKWPTEFTLPDSFNDDLMWFDAQGNPQEWIHYIWPVHGHPGNYTPLDSDDDDTLFWYDPHPHDTPGSSWGFNSETDSDAKFRLRMTYNDGRIDRRSITDTSFDVTYGAARSIDSSSFDLTGNMDSTPWSQGYEDDYGLDANDTAALNALRLQWDKPRTEPGHEDWQYIRSGTQTGFIDQIYGVDFPFAEYDYSPYESDHWQFTGTDGWDRIHPNLNTDASFAKKIIKNVKVGDKISFSYKWYSDTWLYNTENYGDSYITDDYVHDGIRYGDHDWNSSYFRAVIGANNKVVSIKDQYQMIGADPSLTLTDGTYTIPPLPNPDNPEDNELYNEYNITKKDNGFSFPYNGTYEYTVQEGDIDAAGLFQFTTILLAESTNLEYVQVTNFAHTVGDRTRAAAGQLGKTTDAYNLGTSVASLNPNNKKKKEEEEKKRLAEIERIVQMKKREEAKAKIVAAIESAEDKYMQGINKQVEEATVELDNGASTWKGEVNSRWDLSAGKFRDMTIDPKNPSQIPGMKGVKWINSLEELENAGTTADMGSNMYASHLRSLIHGRFQNLDREELDKLIKSPAVRADFLARTSPSFRKWILSVPTDRDYSKSGWTLTSKGSGDFFPAYKARGLNVDNLDSVFTGMDIGQRTGWWLPDDGSWKAYQQIKEATRRAWTFFGWSRYSFPGKSDPSNPGPTIPGKEEQDFELDAIPWELIKKAKGDPKSLTDEELAMINKYIAQDEKNPEPESSDNDDPYHLNLGQIIKKFGNNIGNELAKIYQKLSTYRHAGEAFANFLLQQQGLKNYTKKNPYNVKLPKEDALALAKRINNVLETQIPKERWNDLSQEDLDKINDEVNPESGPTPMNKYREGTGKNEDEYHNIFNNLGERKGLKVKVMNGKPYVTELNDNYVFTDPDDATVRGAPELIKFFTTAGGAQDREDAAGGGEYTYQQFSGDINNLDLKMKNMPIRLKLPIPKVEQDERGNSSGLVREELYPGQPSPSGFPDTPPPQLAPNGYHPQFGKKADRYRRLDPISAKTMDRVKTGDPETDAQVSAAAKSVFERFKKYR